MKKSVLIIGAGLGGLCLAQGLSKAGIRATVFERDPAPNYRGQGHRVHLDDRGERALRACLPDDLYNLHLATRGQPSERFMLISAEEERLREIPFPDLGDGSQMIRTGRGVSRQTLREIMLGGVDVHYDRHLTHYTEESGSVTAHFANGATATGDLLVGADGIGSAVRQQKLPDARVLDTGVRWLGGKTPVTEEIRSSLPESLETAFAAVTGMDPAMMVGYLLFDQSPAGLGLTEPGDYVMWAITVPKDRLPDAIPDLHQKAVSLTATAHPAMRAIVTQAWPDQCFQLSLGTAEPVAGWDPTRVTLLGDAIHAMPPARASGANTALEDAATLTTTIQTESPLAAYEADLRERGFAAVRASTAALEQVAKTIIQT